MCISDYHYFSVLSLKHMSFHHASLMKNKIRNHIRNCLLLNLHLDISKRMPAPRLYPYRCLLPKEKNNHASLLVFLISVSFLKPNIYPWFLPVQNITKSQIHPVFSKSKTSKSSSTSSHGLQQNGMKKDTNCNGHKNYKGSWGTSLVAQWLKIRLPMQGTQVQALVPEDPTCHGATKPVHHNYWTCVLQLLKPVRLEPVILNKRSHHNEKSAHHNKE